MSYSMTTMRESLKNLGYSKGVNPFVGDKGMAGDVNPLLAKQFKYGRAQNFLNDLLEYCWLVYSKAKSATGAQLIGRTGDLWVPEQLSKVGIYDKDKQTLWDSYTNGNIQKMDKWSPTVNDCWVLGGIHRRADFELFSVRTLQNLWDFKRDDHVVTAREILGVLHFGYKLDKNSTPLRFVCEDKAAAHGATIEAYEVYMNLMKGKGDDSIRSVLVMDPKLQSEIQNFNIKTLKHVTPPR